MLVSCKQLLKERTGSSQDHFVCLHLLTILTGKGHISKVIVLSQVSKSTFDVVLEVIPLEAKFFRHFDACSRLDLNWYWEGTNMYQKRAEYFEKTLKQPEDFLSSQTSQYQGKFLWVLSLVTFLCVSSVHCMNCIGHIVVIWSNCCGPVAVTWHEWKSEKW